VAAPPGRGQREQALAWPRQLRGTVLKNLSLRHLRCFVAVAETGSFTQAAARLFQTQSALTATIAQFEDAVGMKLFTRSTRRVEMTADAIRFRPIAERLLTDFDSAIGDLHAIATGQKGHISIAAVPSVMVLFLMPALAEFRRNHPDIAVSVRDGGSRSIERSVLDGEVDFGLCRRTYSYPELDYVPVLRDRFGVICLDSHPLAGIKRPVKWVDLAGQDYIALANDITADVAPETYPEEELTRTLNLRDRASSVASLYAMLGLGGRLSVLPVLAARAGPLREYNFRVLNGPSVSRELCLVTRHVRSFSPNTRRILDVLMHSIRAHGGIEGVHVMPLPATPETDSAS
jgi:DNA-binding transcriptional LysR family regulator